MAPLKLQRQRLQTHVLHLIAGPVCCDLSTDPVYYDLSTDPVYYDLRTDPVYYDLSTNPVRYDLSTDPMYYDLSTNPVCCDLSTDPVCYELRTDPASCAPSGDLERLKLILLCNFRYLWQTARLRGPGHLQRVVAATRHRFLDWETELVHHALQKIIGTAAKNKYGLVYYVVMLRIGV